MFTAGGERAIQDVLNDSRMFIPIEVGGALQFVSKFHVLLVSPV